MMDILLQQKLKVINLALELSGWAPVSSDWVINITEEWSRNTPKDIVYLTYKIDCKFLESQDTVETRFVKIDPLKLALGVHCAGVS